MALGHKYTMYSNAPWGGDDCEFEIYEEGYVGSVSNMKGTRAPVVHRLPGADDDIYIPVRGTEIMINIRSEVEDEFIEFATAVHKQYLGVLNNTTAGLVEWQGWLVPEEFESSGSSLPQTISIRFSCGMGYLAERDYVQNDSAGSYYTGREREIIILAQALSPINPVSPHDVDILDCIGLIPTGASTGYTSQSGLHHTYTDQTKYIYDDGTTWSCLDVIRDILKNYRTFIIMGQSGWWLIRPRTMALIIDGKDVLRTRYNSSGVYQGVGFIDTSTGVKEVTGPHDTSRAVDVAWTGQSKSYRFEKSVKEIQTRLVYGYRNIITLGDFQPNWDDFWIVTNNDPSVIDDPSLIIDNENPDKYNLWMPGDTNTGDVSIKQIIYDISVGSADQELNLSFEFYVEGQDVDNVGGFIAVHVYLDADSGASNDRWLRGYPNEPDAAGGAETPTWRNTVQTLFWSIDYPEEINSWQKVEFKIPVLPFTGDLHIQIDNVGLSSSAEAEGTRLRNVVVLGTYYPSRNPIQFNDLDFLINDDNLIQPKQELMSSGDLDDEGNEWVFCKNAKSLDVDGNTLTTTWRVYYRSGSSKVGYGPVQSLQEFFRDSGIVQYGQGRKRLQGSLTYDWFRIAYSMIKDGDTYYLPTSWNYDKMPAMLRTSMVEIPAIESIIPNVNEENLIANWVNGTGTPPGWDTFTVTADPLIDTLEEGAGGAGTCFADNIESLHPYEAFRVRLLSGNFDSPAPKFVIGSASVVLSDGLDVILTPRTTAGSNIVSLDENAGGLVVHTNILISVTRIYGF